MTTIDVEPQLSQSGTAMLREYWDMVRQTKMGDHRVYYPVPYSGVDLLQALPQDIPLRNPDFGGGPEDPENVVQGSR